MKELIIPLFGNISVGTVQKLYNKSGPPPHPLARLTFTMRLFTEISCCGALCPVDPQDQGDFICLVAEPLTKALTLSRRRSSKLWGIPRRKDRILTLKKNTKTP